MSVAESYAGAIVEQRAQQPQTLVPEASMAALLSKSELDQQIITARAHPRSIKRFFNEAMELATLNERVAEQCIYSVPRDGKVITGPSSRLAEIVANAWGNNRTGARVVDEGAEFITAQGVFHDLEKNAAITFEVRRRITGKNGRRFSPDMIAVTGAAACSIAHRNAVFKAIPKALWSEIEEAARQVAIGDVKTLANRRAAAMGAFQHYGVKPEQIFAVLEVGGLPDITLDHLGVLRGMLTALKDGELTPEEMFPASKPAAPTAEPKRADYVEAPAEPKPDAPAPEHAQPASTGFDFTAYMTECEADLAKVADKTALAEMDAEVSQTLKDQSADEDTLRYWRRIVMEKERVLSQPAPKRAAR